MSSNQNEIKYMLGSLKVMHEKIGGPNASKSMYDLQRRVQGEHSSILSWISFWPRDMKFRNIKIKNKGKDLLLKMLILLIRLERVLSN